MTDEQFKVIAMYLRNIAYATSLNAALKCNEEAMENLRKQYLTAANLHEIYFKDIEQKVTYNALPLEPGEERNSDDKEI